jgi:nucleotide-binding universal stress UspA family protein
VVEFKNVLCAIDLSDASVRTLAYAAAVARWYAARLTVLHVAPTFDAMQVRAGALGDAIDLVQPMPREEVLKQLRTALATSNIAADAATLAAVAGEPAATIVDQALSIPADLLVMGTHGRSGFDRLLLGSVTEKVLHKAPCPILTVPPHAPQKTETDGNFSRILCPMDFSLSALQAFGFAVDLARQSGGSVIALHAIEWLADDVSAHARFNVQDFRQHLIDDAHTRLRALIADQPGGTASIEDVVVIGRAYREVLKTADTGAADLIVMGAQGLGGMGLTLFGSTTQQVVRGATCPVLTVRGR